MWQDKVRDLPQEKQLQKVLSESPERYYSDIDLLWSRRELERLIRQEFAVSRREKTKEWVSLLRVCVITVIVTLLLLQFVAQPVMISGPSMMDSLQDRDLVVLDKLSARFGRIERFDVIVFMPDEERLVQAGITRSTKSPYVKRVIGLPGEVVYIDYEGRIHIAKAYENGEFVDDRILSESYGKETIDRYDRITYGSMEHPAVLGEDEYFVLGDNRNNSTDSRKSVIGAVRLSQVKGKVVFRFYPFSSLGKIS